MFHVSWTTPYGNRSSFTAATAKETIDEIAARGLEEAPGLKIKDDGGVRLPLGDLQNLALMQDAHEQKGCASI